MARNTQNKKSCKVIAGLAFGTAFLLLTLELMESRYTLIIRPSLRGFATGGLVSAG
jgi:hypothetical protein